MSAWSRIGLVLLLVCCLSQAEANESEEHSTQRALDSMQLSDDSLTIELVASKPNVIDPVAIAWDEHGRMYVAEMRDYPVGPVGGSIRLLEDKDGDGRYETAHLFAEGLPFPNSVMPWKGGVLVSAAPDVLFLKDTDGDHKADERRVVLTGFGEGNQQLRVNSLHWSLDNWVYAANGRSDGSVLLPGEPAEKAVPLRRHDLRFNADTGAFQPISGCSQFGLCEDDWGNRFLSWNTVPIRHVVLEEETLLRNPLLAVTNVEANIADPIDSGRVFPIVPPQQRYNRESVEFFNASCGLTIYRGDALPDYAGDAFVCESLSSFVHRRKLSPDGATFIAKRMEQGKEFLASQDSWFRPVNLATGPDGALYVVDFCRKWVEHPDFVPKQFRDEVDWRTGDDLGRIWRIRKKTSAPHSVPKLDAAKPKALVRALGHKNAWVRMTAQRLLVERGEKDIVSDLKKVLAKSSSEKARLHALYTLDGIGGLSGEHIALGIRDASPHVRRCALSLLNPKTTDWAALRTSLAALAHDADPRVRLQLATTNLPEELAITIRLELIESMQDDTWERLGILTGLSESAPDVFKAIWRDKALLEKASPLILQGDIAELIGASGKTDQVSEMLGLVAAVTPLSRAHIVAAAGFARGLDRTGASLATVFAAVERFQPFQKAIASYVAEAIQNEEIDAATRLEAIALTARGLSPEAAEVLPRLIKSDVPEAVRIAAINAVVSTGNVNALKTFFSEWSNLAVTTRRALIQGCVASADTAAPLLDALEARQIRLRELDGQVRETLANYPNESLRNRTNLLLAGDVRSGRSDVIKSYEPALHSQGDAARGAIVFKDNCLPCHRVQGVGNHVGPDLSGIASRAKEKLLVDILDPNSEVAPDFVAFTAVTGDLDVIVGVLAGETPTAITIRQAQGVEQNVLRSNLQKLSASMLSLMPEGFETAIAPEGMADLLEYLHHPQSDR